MPWPSAAKAMRTSSITTTGELCCAATEAHAQSLSGFRVCPLPSREAVAEEAAWFTYYYWEDDARAPDFAQTVDIHRKPGYDPVELFSNPALSPLALKTKVAWRLLQKKLGFRMLMDVIPLDASLVKGSHGRRPADRNDWPLFITERKELLQSPQLEATDVYHALVRHVLH